MEVWHHARDQGFTLLTKDRDFLALANSHGYPPKVILITLGNRSTPAITSFLTTHAGLIREFISQSPDAVLILPPT